MIVLGINDSFRDCNYEPSYVDLDAIFSMSSVLNDFNNLFFLTKL